MVGAITALERKCWPVFMNEAPSCHEAGEGPDWSLIYERYPEFVFGMLDPDSDDLLGAGHCVPVFVKGGELPDTGWDWAWRQSMGPETAERPNALCALAIIVDPEKRSSGLAPLALATMRALAIEHGFATLYAPLRPTHLDRHPTVDIADYVTWRLEGGDHFDPWIRLHERAGGRIGTVCRRSMTMSASVDKWSEWSGLPLTHDGEIIVPHLLTPLNVDLAAGLATYIEPNVWIIHDLAGAAIE
ncbi:MAG: hypothetical protein KIS66_06310 [Fimbriimonadaceae bacterium]|nr:hypothetical protein [Fimbriimonadaceae bacterium]